MLNLFRLLAAAGIAYLSLAVPASAHHRSGHYAGQHHYHYRAAKVHHGGKPHLGYWRRGPAKGYGFGFSTYRGDPFGDDDYYDGDRCYYVNHENFCMPNHIFNGFD